MKQNYIEYTESLLKFISETEKRNEKMSNVLILGPGYNPHSEFLFLKNSTFIPPEGEDIIKYIEEFRGSDKFRLFDYVIMSRVLEHLEIRNLDWYLFNIYTIMKNGSKLICTVPDMKYVSNFLIDQFEKYKNKDSEFSESKIKRFNYELFSEGKDIMFRHSTWTDENSMKYYLESEGLFKVKETNNVIIDSMRQLEVIAERI